MRTKTQAEFAAELDALQRKLHERGRNVQKSDSEREHSGIRFDFDLPYSTLPSLENNRWTNRGFA